MREIEIHDYARQLLEAHGAKAIAEAAQNAIELSRAAHSIKGSSSNFGASELAAIASEIEHKGKAAAFDEVQARLPTLKEAFNRVRPALLELKTGG